MSESSKLSVVVEGRSDAVLLARLLSRALSLQPRFYAGGGQLSLATLARNILVHEGGSLLLVMDVDTTEAEGAAEACAMTRAALRQVAVDETFTVFAFVPQLDVAFFEAHAVLQRHFGEDLGGASVEIGRLVPRRTLQTILSRHGTSREEFYRSLDERALDLLLKGPQVGELVAAVGSLISKPEGVGSAS